MKKLQRVNPKQVLSAIGEHYMSVPKETRGHYRYGQVIFNTLAEHWPEHAEAIRGTKDDMFHDADAQVAIDKLYKYMEW